MSNFVHGRSVLSYFFIFGLFQPLGEYLLTSVHENTDEFATKGSEGTRGHYSTVGSEHLASDRRAKPMGRFGSAFFLWNFRSY